MTTAGSADASAKKAAKAAARKARQLRWMYASVASYPRRQLVIAAVYGSVMGALDRRLWVGVLWGVAAAALGLWTWRPGGRGRQRLAARYLGFMPRPARAVRSRAERIFLATAAAWLLTSVLMLGFLAIEAGQIEIACPTPDGWDYADARWGWFPPGPHCAAVADVDGRIHGPSSPSPWRWILLVVPAAGLGAVVVTGRRWRREDGRLLSPVVPSVTGEERVIAFYADPRRRTSPAVEFGYPWLESERIAWRLRWITGTGELVGFRLAWPPTSSALAWAGDSSGRPAVTAVAVVLVDSDATRVRHLLEGYEQHVGRPDGWEWVRSRVSATHTR